MDSTPNYSKIFSCLFSASLTTSNFLGPLLSCKAENSAIWQQCLSYMY
jgi:hypothetical protein